MKEKSEFEKRTAEKQVSLLTEVLQRRVMEQAEWIIMPKAIDLIANGKVEVVDGLVKIKE